MMVTTQQMSTNTSLQGTHVNAVPPILHLNILIAIDVLELHHRLCILGLHKAKEALSANTQDCVHHLNTETILHVRQNKTATAEELCNVN